jgi:saccharopine dehydrogenase-like NADP-dependent oxidoreductase
MKRILIIGAGRSTSHLIQYLGNLAKEKNWHITIADINIEMARSKVFNDYMQAFFLDISDIKNTDEAIQDTDIVVSMLPAHMHISVAKLCLKHRKNLVTASYMSDEMIALSKEAQNKNLIFLNEIGVDPGLDHLSAIKALNEIRNDGGEILDYESFTGGLVAPGYDNNPWKYKLTWNPRNVVLAAQGGVVQFIQEGQYKFIPYNKVFRRTEIIDIEGYGKFEGYANRDSLKYRETYGLENVRTMYRGTLRRPGFCRAWNCFVELGATDDSYILDCENMTYRDYINNFLAYHPTDSVEIKLRQYLKIDQDDVDLWEKLVWLGLFENKEIGLRKATPAQILQKLLEEKWCLSPNDKDMLVMWHKIIYQKNNKKYKRELSMVCLGENETYTAMSKTVGLPLGLATKHILDGTYSQRGAVLPISADIYEPILSELSEYGIVFNEEEQIIST